jgi:hypothetical protein
MDNVYWRHFGGSPSASNAARTAGKIHRVVRAYSARPSAKTERELGRALLVPAAREVSDAVIAAFEHEPVTNRSVAHAGIRQLAETTDQPEVLKLCLVLLGFFGDETDNGLFKLVGMYGDFTPFAAAGISLANHDPSVVLLELAPTTDGWGRVTIVEALLSHRSADVCEYLLRSGFQGLMPELGAEVAWDVATKCDLLGAITGPSPDEDLVRGVGTILETLEKSPFKDLGDYVDGAAATVAFLARFDPLVRTIWDFQTVATLHDRVVGSTEAERAALPWSTEERTAVVTRARPVLDRPEWQGAVVAAFADPTLRFDAVRLAQRFGMPYRERVVAWLREEPLQSAWWYVLCEKPTAEQIDEVLDLAEEILEVDAIATGPADELGLGPEFERDSCVGYILQALRGIPSMEGRPAEPGFPGRGEGVLLAALQSPVVRNRRVAMSAIEAWAPGSITPRLHERLRALNAGDPNQEAREQAVALLDRLGAARLH